MSGRVSGNGPLTCTGGAATVDGRYEARAVTRLGVELVEVVWIPEGGGPPGTPLFAVAAERVPLIAAALAAWMGRAGA